MYQPLRGQGSGKGRGLGSGARVNPPVPTHVTGVYGSHSSHPVPQGQGNRNNAHSFSPRNPFEQSHAEGDFSIPSVYSKPGDELNDEEGYGDGWDSYHNVSQQGSQASNRSHPGQGRNNQGNPNIPYQDYHLEGANGNGNQGGAPRNGGYPQQDNQRGYRN